MKSTLTIRLDSDQQKALAESARRQGRSISAIVRDAIDRVIGQHPISVRAGHLKGRLKLGSSERANWGGAIRTNNWRS